MSLILASGSPRRKELLALITPDFITLPSDFDERAVTAPTPKELAGLLAQGKCRAVAQSRPGDLVLGCDTVVEFEGRVFGKPADKADARRMLRALSGAAHWVHTGVCLRKGGAERCEVASTQVRFYPISEAELEAYIATDEPYDKAGGYAIQGRAALFCQGIEGCYYNVMGLPVSRVARMLQNFE